jgi:hypothetical protein
VVHHTEKRRKLIIFITGLHNKPQGCGASVASAAGPFTIKKTRNEKKGHKKKKQGATYMPLHIDISFIVEIKVTQSLSSPRRRMGECK